MQTIWDKHKKPPAEVCPGLYCYHWIMPGGSADMSRRIHGSVEEALSGSSGWQVFPDGGCSCSFGLCSRLDPVHSTKDWYEPCEPFLERDDLPWFYFTPSGYKLSPEKHEKYLLESQALWGNEEI